MKKLDSNWDGYGSERPSANVIGKANDVWDLTVGAFGHSLPLPEVAPGSSGLIAFTWKLAPTGRELELWVRDEKVFTADCCLKLENGQLQDYELQALGDLIPVLQAFVSARVVDASCRM